MRTEISDKSSSTLKPLDGEMYIAKTREDRSSEDKDWYITGGSSGGSAVAVATGTVFGYVLKYHLVISQSNTVQNN